MTLLSLACKQIWPRVLTAARLKPARFSPGTARRRTNRQARATAQAVDMFLPSWHFYIMIKTQVKSQTSFSSAQKAGAEKEWSFAEVVRRGLEQITQINPRVGSRPLIGACPKPCRWGCRWRLRRMDGLEPRGRAQMMAFDTNLAVYAATLRCRSTPLRAISWIRLSA